MAAVLCTSLFLEPVMRLLSDDINFYRILKSLRRFSEGVDLNFTRMASFIYNNFALVLQDIDSRNLSGRKIHINKLMQYNETSNNSTAVVIILHDIIANSSNSNRSMQRIWYGYFRKDSLFQSYNATESNEKVASPIVSVHVSQDKSVSELANISVEFTSISSVS